MKVEWVNASERVPDNDRRVMVVKVLKSGRKELAFGYFAGDFNGNATKNGGYQGAGSWVTTGCQNVAYWAELPDMPEEVSE